MNPLELHDLLLWCAVIALVVITVMTGRWLNRFLTYRAHRQALAELRRRALRSHPSAPDIASRLSALPCETGPAK